VLGSVVMLTDSNGAAYQRYSYDAWGKVTARDASGSVIASSAISAPWLFTGRRFDKESGLYHYRARTYSAELGRFLQMDPIKFDAGDPNIFRYVGNNPINGTDPRGEFGVGAVVGGVAGAVAGGVSAHMTGGSVLTGALIGGLTGALIGAVDPTEGALTLGEIAGNVGALSLAGGISGAVGDLIGQIIDNPCHGVNWGEVAGAGVSAGVATGVAAVAGITGEPAAIAVSAVVGSGAQIMGSVGGSMLSH
jgi:RHS repeat-associated protein